MHAFRCLFPTQDPGLPPWQQFPDAALDHLALQFIAEDWSVKKVIREMVLSRTYQLSSAFESTAFTTDPENALRWRADKRRLDAEALRDAILTVSGKLEIEPPYGSVIAQQSRNLLLLPPTGCVKNGIQFRLDPQKLCRRSQSFTQIRLAPTILSRPAV